MASPSAVASGRLLIFYAKLHRQTGTFALVACTGYRWVLGVSNYIRYHDELEQSCFFYAYMLLSFPPESLIRIRSQRKCTR